MMLFISLICKISLSSLWWLMSIVYYLAIIEHYKKSLQVLVKLFHLIFPLTSPVYDDSRFVVWEGLTCTRKLKVVITLKLSSLTPFKPASFCNASNAQ